ncbi:hypothetical protein AB0L82_14240 [Nocardia sp. NPDC052001]|uniref:hypothetical protein n=1 Tax=unclassified Nocardia TaxID=2637762 RepID=UPI003444F9D4
MTAEQVFNVEVRAGDRDIAEELGQWLEKSGIEEVSVTRERGMIDLQALEYLISATLVELSVLARLGFWIREKTHCRTVYDVRAKTVLTEMDCRIRDGKIVVITKKGATVYEPGTPVDLNKILGDALGSA